MTTAAPPPNLPTLGHPTPESPRQFFDVERLGLDQLQGSSPAAARLVDVPLAGRGDGQIVVVLQLEDLHH